MKFEGWYLMLGVLMLGISFLDRYFKRLPITTTMVYLVVGIVLGPSGLAIAVIDPVANSGFLERVSELAVIVSLFTAGLKLGAPSKGAPWKMPVRLAFVSMTVTVTLIAVFSIMFLDFSIGAAVLLGAILAPTDPVLASDVQLEHPGDRDRLRFSLTGEAGLNDGTAFPFVMLGLGFLGIHEIGLLAWRWLVVDLVWAVSAGLGIGGLFGFLTGKYIVYLRRKHEETTGRDEFIALGLIGFSYGASLYLHAYGFLAVFAAGLTLRYVEMKSFSADVTDEEPRAGDFGTGIDDTQNRPLAMTRAVLNANEQIERILSIGLVLILGMMLDRQYLVWESVWLALFIFLVIRPVSVLLGIMRTEATGLQRTLLAWFGVRGIGSMYYLMYALEKHLTDPLSETLVSLVLGVMIASILFHGISVTPIMNYYNRRKEAGGQEGPVPG